MKLDVNHIAKLSNIPLNDNEVTTLEDQLDETLKYIESLQEIDTKNIQPTSHVTGLENITREDISQPSLTQKEALQNAKSTHAGFIQVNQILDTE